MSEEQELPEHAARNREHWDELAAGYVSAGERQWGSAEATWGSGTSPSRSCTCSTGSRGWMRSSSALAGTAYVSAWLVRCGARPVGIDNSPKQLETAERLQREHGLEFPLLLGNAKHVPYPDASFDFAISEYGACLWADPHVWVAEAARLLRPGGRLVFLTNGYLLMLCAPDAEEDPATDRLLRPSFGMHRFEWPDDPSVEFHLAHCDWIRVLRENGFEVEDLIELQAPADATSKASFVSPEWAHRWPSEEVWVARKRG